MIGVLVSAPAIVAQSCATIGGAYSGTEESHQTLTYAGLTDSLDDSYKISNVQIRQTGCTFSYTVQTVNGSPSAYTRTGTLDGNKIVSLSGPVAVALDPGIRVARNEITSVTGSITSGTIVMEMTGVAEGIYQGLPGRFDVRSTVTLNGPAIPVSTAPARYALTLASDPPGAGSIIANPLAGADGKYAAGTVVTLTAAPSARYVFDSWSGDIGGSGNPISISLDTNRTVVAKFALAHVTPAAPLRLSIAWRNAAPHLTFAGEPGIRCSVEYSPALAPTQAWLSLTNVTLTSSPFSFADDTHSGSTTRFYRAKQLP